MCGLSCKDAGFTSFKYDPQEGCSFGKLGQKIAIQYENDEPLVKIWTTVEPTAGEEVISLSQCSDLLKLRDAFWDINLLLLCAVVFTLSPLSFHVNFVKLDPLLLFLFRKGWRCNSGISWFPESWYWKDPETPKFTAQVLGKPSCPVNLVIIDTATKQSCLCVCLFVWCNFRTEVLMIYVCTCFHTAGFYLISSCNPLGFVTVRIRTHNPPFRGETWHGHFLPLSQGRQRS